MVMDWKSQYGKDVNQIRSQEKYVQVLSVGLVEIYRVILSFTWKCRGPKMATPSLKKKSKAGRVMPLYANISDKAS